MCVRACDAHRSELHCDTPSLWCSYYFFRLLPWLRGRGRQSCSSRKLQTSEKRNRKFDGSKQCRDKAAHNQRRIESETHALSGRERRGEGRIFSNPNARCLTFFLFEQLILCGSSSSIRILSLSP